MSVEMSRDADRPLFATVLRRHWRSVVVAVVVCALLGVAVGAVSKHTYSSTATVLIAPLEGDPYAPESVGKQSQANTDALTDSRLAATPAVARLAEKELRLPRASLLWRSKVLVDVVPNTQVVKITYRASSGRRAKASAQAFARSYLRYRANRSRASIAAQLHQLEAFARRTQRQLNAATHAGHSQRTQVAIYTNELATLSGEIAQLAGASSNPGEVVSSASAPAASGVPTAAFAFVGAIVGLLLGLGYAVVREKGDDSLREGSDLEDAGLPVLGGVTSPQRVPAAAAADESERYRRLRTAILTNAPAPRVIAMSSLSPTIVSGAVATRLGSALALAGYEVTVVHTSPGSDRSSEDRPGLADVLLDGLDPHDVREVVAPGLYRIEPGGQIEAAAEMYASTNLSAVLHDLAGKDAYVLVAAPSADTAHAAALSAVCDEAILVCALGESTSTQLSAAMREVQRVRGRLLGAIVIAPRATPEGPGAPRAARDFTSAGRELVNQWRTRFSGSERETDDPAESRLRALSDHAVALERRLKRAGSGSGPADGGSAVDD
jgi:capsular polysaccharide biosynthesis protein/Mrp family chromosome partitioning ATPase